MKKKTRRLALDIGGANLKAAHSDGMAMTLPFALWRDPEGLTTRLRVLADRLPDYEEVAMTTTAELCDCFASKAEGVLAILNAVDQLRGDRPLRIWGVDGRFHDRDSIRATPRIAAAANWLALAAVAAKRIGNEAGLLIDVGSTTTDLIPLQEGDVVARGRTDLERLVSRELVYAGVRRTPICALATRLPFRSRDTGLTAELFATTLDVFLTLGEIPEDALDRDTADGRPATVTASRDRLARMVGADREEFSESDARSFSGMIQETLIDRLAEAVVHVSSTLTTSPSVVLTSGSGEFLARRVVARAFGSDARVLSFTEVWGPAGREAACAMALLDLVADDRDMV